MRVLILIAAAVLGLGLLVWWQAPRNLDIQVPEEVPYEATLTVDFDRIEGDVDPHALSRWLTAASGDIRLGYQSSLVVWPFTAEFKVHWGSYLPIPTLSIEPTTFWLRADREHLTVDGLRLTVRVREIVGRLLHLKAVTLGAELPSAGLGLPAQQGQLEIHVRPWTIHDDQRLGNEVTKPFVMRHATFVAHGVLNARGTYAVPVWVREPALTQADGAPYRSPRVPHRYAWTLLSMAEPGYFDISQHDPDRIGLAVDAMSDYQSRLARRLEQPEGCPCDDGMYPEEEVLRIRAAVAAAGRLVEGAAEVRPYPVNPRWEAFRIGDLVVRQVNGDLTTAKRHGDWLQSVSLSASHRAGDAESSEPESVACEDYISGHYLFVNQRLVGFKGKAVNCAARDGLEDVVILYDESGRLASFTAYASNRIWDDPRRVGLSHDPNPWVLERVEAAARQAALRLLQAIPASGG
jgi:hypothetical protein